MTKGKKIKEILGYFKVMLMVFVAVFAFVMTSREWFVSIQYIGFFVQFLLIWLVEDFYKHGHRLRDLGISISDDIPLDED